MFKTQTATVEIHHRQQQPPVQLTTANLRPLHKEAVHWKGTPRPNLIRDRQTSSSAEESPQTDQSQTNTGLLTIVAENMTVAKVHRVIEDARRANTELHIRDNIGKVSQNNYNTPNKGEEDDI